MALGKPKLTVIFAPGVLTELNLIWNYNALHRGEATAESYQKFLLGKLVSLSTNYRLGKIIDANPDWRYLIMKKRSLGDGHIAVYRIDFDTGMVRVLHIFHTKQSWQDQIMDND